MKCTELVIQDRAILPLGLDIFDAIIRRMEGGERVEIADLTAILKFFRFFGDDYFPAAHSEPQALVATIGDALSSRRGGEFVRGSRRLSVLLRDHLDRDGVLRDIADRSLLMEEASALASELKKLEWKYIRKPLGNSLSAGRAQRAAVREY